MLSTRREKILGAIVEQYIATGEPVGSKTLLSKLSISVSSATIRNDMAALTKLDLIYQPHTSAGRIPTEKGYRYYVDNLMKPEELGEGDRRRIEAGVDTRSGDPEILLEKVGEALGELTNFAAMATTPADENASIRNIRMAPVSSRTCVVVLLTSTGILKSKACRMDTEITDDIIQSFRDIVGREFIGKPLKEIRLKPNVLLVGIAHGGSTEIPNGDSSFQLGDTVVVVDTNSREIIRQLNDIFA